MRIASRSGNMFDNFLFTCCVAYLGPFAFGYVIGYSSPAVPSLISEGLLDETLGGWFASLVAMGGFLGCPLAGWCVERYGRRQTLSVIYPIFGAGWCLIFSKFSVNFLLFGRFLTGVASSMVTVTSPMYIAEISPKDLRGKYGSGVQLAITVGIFVVNLLGVFLKWQYLAAIGLVFPIASFVLNMKIPESPRFYLIKDRKTDAIRALQWLRPNHSIESVNDEFRDMEESLPEKEETFSMSEFGKPELFRPLVICIGLQLFQQFSGINVVMFYTVSIFERAGFAGQSTWAATFVNLMQVMFTVVACLMMDRAGRRVLLILAGLGMSCACFTLGISYYSLENTPTVTSAPMWPSYLALTSVLVYIVAFSIGLGPIPMLLASEIFPARAKGPAAGMSMLCNWFSAFIVTLSFVYVKTIFGTYGTFWIYAACCAAGVLFVFRYIPETKGRSLEDMELYFLGRSTRVF